MYYYPQPPYFLIVSSLLIGVVCGAAFESLLKETMKKWSKKANFNLLDQLDTLELRLPFWGICLGIWLFLASGLEIFSVPSWLSYGLSLGMTLFTASLVWSQLVEVLQQLQKGGSRAIDLDSFDND